MKTKFFAIAAVAVLVASSAAAADFEFDVNLDGDGTLEWEFDLNESEKWTDSAGAEFDFSGGAGVDGNANAYGQWTGVGGVFGEYAYGSGDAYSNTLGGNYAESEFHAASGGINVGFAADANFSGDPSKMKYDSIITAGGAGSAGTGQFTGKDYSYHQDGTGSYSVDADLSGSYTD